MVGSATRVEGALHRTLVLPGRIVLVPMMWGSSTSPGWQVRWWLSYVGEYYGARR